MILKKGFLVAVEGIDGAGKITQGNSLNEYFEKRGWKTVLSKDPTDRRSVTDRRQFLFAVHIPERRSGIDRRCGSDRRSAPL